MRIIIILGTLFSFTFVEAKEPFSVFCMYENKDVQAFLDIDLGFINSTPTIVGQEANAKIKYWELHKNQLDIKQGYSLSFEGITTINSQFTNIFLFDSSGLTVLRIAISELMIRNFPSSQSDKVGIPFSTRPFIPSGALAQCWQKN